MNRWERQRDLLMFKIVAVQKDLRELGWLIELPVTRNSPDNLERAIRLRTALEGKLTKYRLALQEANKH